MPAAVETLADVLARIGPMWASDIRRHSQAVKELYDPILAQAPRDGVEIRRNLAYGPHPRQVLDLFRPRAAAPAPVVAFMHGGAFVRGDKCTTDQIYDNVLIWFARQGWLGVNLEYRLAPESPYPGGALDLAAALDWLHAQLPSLGGDPARVHLIGHSAGGTHVASYLCDPRIGRYGRGVRSAVLVSARLQADVWPDNPNRHGVAAYFGEDPALYDERSPMQHAEQCRVPVLIVTAQYENPLLDSYGAEFARRLREAGRVPVAHVQLAHHNHMSIVAQVNTPQDELGPRMLAFLAQGAA